MVVPDINEHHIRVLLVSAETNQNRLYLASPDLRHLALSSALYYLVLAMQLMSAFNCF